MILSQENNENEYIESYFDIYLIDIVANLAKDY